MADNGKAKAAGSISNLKALEDMIEGASGSEKALPPVEKWNPPFCGDLDMEIRADGTWFYMGTPIGRLALVKLFSSVLRKDEDGKTYLVTPVEKVGIRVIDAPFLAVEMHVTGEGDAQKLTFRTLTDDIVEAGPDNRLRFEMEKETMGLKPYLHMRGRLEALVARPVMYDLVAIGEHLEIEGVSMFAVRSNGVTFPIMPSADLEEASA